MTTTATLPQEPTLPKPPVVEGPHHGKNEDIIRRLVNREVGGCLSNTISSLHEAADGYNEDIPHVRYDYDQVLTKRFEEADDCHIELWTIVDEMIYADADEVVHAALKATLTNERVNDLYAFNVELRDCEDTPVASDYDAFAGMYEDADDVTHFISQQNETMDEITDAIKELADYLDEIEDEVAGLRAWMEDFRDTFYEKLDEHCDVWLEEDENNGRSLCDQVGVEPSESEIYEYWAIPSSLTYEHLLRMGEVAFEVDGIHGWVWGRCTTGQAIYADSVWYRMARDMEILDGQENEWVSDTLRFPIHDEKFLEEMRKKVGFPEGTGTIYVQAEVGGKYAAFRRECKAAGCTPEKAQEVWRDYNTEVARIKNAE